MKLIRLLVAVSIAAGCCFVTNSHAANVDFFIFKATGSITGTQVLPPLTPTGNSVFFVKTFSTNDIVNIALGNPLGTKLVDRILAVAMCYNNERTRSKLVVYNPTTGTIVTDVALIATLDLEVGDVSNGQKGVGFATVNLVPTADPGSKASAILSGTLTGGASGALPFDTATTPQDVNGYAISFKIGSGVGRLNFKYTDPKGAHTMNGVVSKGLFATSGKKLKHLVINVP